jgi:[ribosomal protein S5]-alanine N-acetyltransferase
MESRPSGSITIRALQPSDRPALQAMCSRNFADLATALPVPSVLLQVPADDWVAGLLARRAAGTAYPYVVLDGVEIVGAVAVHDVVDGKHADLTVWVDARARGRGTATAAVAQLRLIAQDTIGLQRLAGAAQLSNGAAHRVLEKNRFELIGRARGYRLVAGRWQDHLLFHRVLSRPVTTRLAEPGSRRPRV